MFKAAASSEPVGVFSPHQQKSLSHIERRKPEKHPPQSLNPHFAAVM